MYRVAVTYPRYFWLHKHSRVRVHQIRAIARHPEVELTVTGQGWPGWDDSLPVRDNLHRICGEVDAIRAYTPLGHKRFKIGPLLDLHHAPAPLCLAYNEMWDMEWTMQEIEDSHASFVICHHENDLRQYRELHPSFGWHHIPHCAERSVFEDDGRQKKVNAVLTGTVSKEFYPLRDTFERLIELGRIDAVQRKHPGYWLGPERCEQQVQEYGECLRDARLSLCTSSRYKYCLSKYLESWMAGAVVCGDMPNDGTYSSAFYNLQCVIRDDADDDEIQDQFDFWMNRDGHTEERRQMGARIAREQFSMERYAEDFVNVLRQEVR